VPDAHADRWIDRGQPPPVGVEGEAVGPCCHSKPLLVCLRIPDLDAAIGAARNEHSAVGAHGHAGDEVAVAADDVELLATDGIPDADRAILPPAEQRLAVAAGGQASGAGRM